MKADGSVKGQQKISSTKGDFSGNLDPSDNFGSAVTAVGDMNGDGVEDNVSDGWASWKFDKFYNPAVFHEVEDINNTHHGNLPGML